MEISFPNPNNKYDFENSAEEVDYRVIAEKTGITSQIIETSRIFYEPEGRIGEKLRRSEKQDRGEKSNIQP